MEKFGSIIKEINWNGGMIGKQINMEEWRNEGVEV